MHKDKRIQQQKHKQGSVSGKWRFRDRCNIRNLSLGIRCNKWAMKLNRAFFCLFCFALFFERKSLKMLTTKKKKNYGEGLVCCLHVHCMTYLLCLFPLWHELVDYDTYSVCRNLRASLTCGALGYYYGRFTPLGEYHIRELWVHCLFFPPSSFGVWGLFFSSFFFFNF